MTSTELNNMFNTLDNIEKELKITNDRQFCKSIYSKCDAFKNAVNKFEISFDLLKKINHVWFVAHQRDNELWFDEKKTNFISMRHEFQKAFECSKNTNFTDMMKRIDNAGEHARQAIDHINLN